MSRWLPALGIGVVLVMSMGFAALNAGQRVTLRLGVVTFYRVPLTVAIFGALVLGMVVMLVAGVWSDLRVRRILRERLAEEDREEKARIFVDESQQDLFDGSE
ncbi:MAG TPA: lipopolysaccharide assembly protein LapA domain-containing protein [Longimicrobiales bacterium]|nr:lipopolysaccharide assembly protein LapA domain-containing protein [Longimicrobiales bacterium]